MELLIKAYEAREIRIPLVIFLSYVARPTAPKCKVASWDVWQCIDHKYALTPTNPEMQR